VEAHSAGTEATAVRPSAVRAMAEAGIDVSGQISKTLRRYLDGPFDAVVTVCDDADESCPVIPGARARLHMSLPDPSEATGSVAEQLALYREVRDELRRRVAGELLPRLAPSGGG
jgi:arsenate reductase (thioredoxin)